MDIHRPYPLEGGTENTERSEVRKRLDNRIQEFAWAFGDETEQIIEHQVRIQIERLRQSGNISDLMHGSWSYKDAMEQDQWIMHLEEHLKDIVQVSETDERSLLSLFENSRNDIFQRLQAEDPNLAESFLKQREKLDEELKKKYPEIYARILKIRN